MDRDTLAAGAGDAPAKNVPITPVFDRSGAAPDAMGAGGMPAK